MKNSLIACLEHEKLTQRSIRIDNNQVYDKLNKYIRTLPNDIFLGIRKLFGLQKANYECVKDLYDNKRKLFYFANAVLEGSFQLSIQTSMIVLINYRLLSITVMVTTNKNSFSY